MAAIKNKRDKFLQDPANAPRLNVVASNYIQLSSPTLVFRKTAAGISPSTIPVLAVGMGRLEGLPVTFSTVSGTGTVSVAGNTATVSNVTTNNIIIKASITYLGNTYEALTTITAIDDTVICSISKSSASVPADHNGTNPVLTTATSTATIIVGSTIDTANWTYLWTIFSGSGTLSGSTTSSVNVATMTTDSITVRLTATKATYPTQTLDFVVTKAKAGPPGADGTDGVPGTPGANGVTLYTWIAYANNSSGSSGFTTGANTGQTYIGIANNKTSATESTTPADYVWSLIKGTDGVPGTPGANGTTTYTWFAYANNSSGSSGFTTGAWTNQTYIGLATNKTTATESQTPGDYTWSLIKGDQGIQGPAGANGTNGTNGTNGSAGARGSMTFYASGSAWSDTTANSTVTTITGSSTKIIGDTVTISNGSSFAGTKYWGGSSWLAPGVVIDGNLLVSGTMSASKIGAGTVTANGIVLSSTYGSVAFGNSSSGGIVANFLANAASQYGVFVSSGKLGVTEGFTLLGGGLMSGQLKQSGSILAGTATTDSGLITDSAYVPIQGKAFNGGHGLRGRNYGSTASGVVGASNGKAFHAESGTAGPFTGSHDVAVPIGVTLEPGTIVVDTACLIRRDWSNTFCSVAVTTQANQKGVVGVYTSDLGPLSQYSILSAAYEQGVVDDFGNVVGPLTDQFNAIKYDYNVGEINALGEGQLLVCGEGGDLEAGDLIVSSSIPGKGMKQSDDLVRSYTVAKSREAVIFSSPDEVKRVACIYLCG